MFVSRSTKMYGGRNLSILSAKFQTANKHSKVKNEGGSGVSTKTWNEAACIMAIAPMNQSEPHYLGYLMVERSGTGKIMPGNWVYPGGNTDPGDSDIKWASLFQEIQNVDILHEDILQSGAERPEIYTSNNDDELIPKEISLRITAVREMFEEAGILLCKPRNIDADKHLYNGQQHYEFAELQDKKILQECQKRIRKNAPEFIQVCKELDCVPDIHALQEWSNWLSPTRFKPKSRFDTINYMIVLPKMPRVVIDGNEAVKAQWISPSTIIAEYERGEAKLMPPQLYEMSRLKKLSSVREIKERLKARRNLGIERYFPVFRKVTDGTIILLPGDDLYPVNPDYVGTEPAIQEIPNTIAELRESSKNLHRAIVNTDGVITSFEINVSRFGNVY